MSKILSAIFSPDEQYIASASEDATVKVWDVQKGFKDTSCQDLQGHEEPFLSVCFSSDGALVFSGSADKTIRA